MYGTPYLSYNIYFYYLSWFFIICGGYIIIRGDLFIISKAKSNMLITLTSSLTRAKGKSNMYQLCLRFCRSSNAKSKVAIALTLPLTHAKAELKYVTRFTIPLMCQRRGQTS